MNRMRIISFLCLFFLCGSFTKKVIASEREAQILMEEFKKEVASASTGREKLAVCKTAFESQRSDLLQICFDAGLVAPFCQLLSEETDQRLKNAAVLVMLNGASEVWGDTLPHTTANLNRVQQAALAAECVEILKSYLPQDKMKLVNFSSRDERLKIAAMFKAALVEK